MIDNNSSLTSRSNVSGVSPGSSSDKVEPSIEAVFIDANRHRENMNAMLKMMGSKAKIEKKEPGSRNVSLAVDCDEDERGRTGDETSEGWTADETSEGGISSGVFRLCCSKA